MKHRNIPVLLGAALLFCAQLATAAVPTDAQIDKLMSVMHAKDTVAAILPQVEGMQKQMVAKLTAGQALTPEQQARLDRITSDANAQIRQTLTWDKLQPLYRDIYKQSFDSDDVDAMVGFYSSPAGQRVLAKMPQLMQHTMAAVQQLVVPMLQGMQHDIQAETKADGSAAPAK